MTLDFSGYFDATENAFAEEKEEMLYKIANIQMTWANNVAMDEAAKVKCAELLELKEILKKDHLQILRIREEELQMRIKNATLGFQVRQLQKEIFRLLPHSQSYVPSTEYHMSLDREVYREKAPTLRIEADPLHAKDLVDIHRSWRELCEIQSQVFDEEMKKAEEDREQWDKFARDFRAQNAETHKMIDTQLADLTKKLIFLKSQNEETIAARKETIDTVGRKLTRLGTKHNSMSTSLGDKSVEERGKARVEAAKKVNLVRGRVREIERKNLARFSAMKEIDSGLQERELSLLRATDKLSERLATLNRNKTGLVAEGNDRISRLEEQMNAVLSAAAAISDCTAAEQEKLLGAVAGAIGHHGTTVRGVERLNLGIRALSGHLDEATAGDKVM